MGQYHALVNLEKNVVIEPNSMGEFTKLMEWGHGGATLASMIYLLGDEDGWQGEHVAIVGDYAEKSDLSAEQQELLAVPVENLWNMMGKDGGNRLKRQSWMARKLLEDKGVCSFTDGRVFKYEQTWAEDSSGRIPAPADDVQDVVVVNLDKKEFLEPQAFGDTGSLHDLAVNSDCGGTPTALVVLLAIATKPVTYDDGSEFRGGRGGGDLRLMGGLSKKARRMHEDRMGAWGGDRIAILPRDEVVGMSAMTDISGALRELLVDAGVSKFATDADGKVTRSKGIRF